MRRKPYDYPPLYYRLIAPLMYLVSAVFVVGAVVHLIYVRGTLGVLFYGLSMWIAGSAIAFLGATWSIRHAAKLEREQSVNPPGPNPDAASELN